MNYLALLRGINVGGNTKLPMKELVTAMEADGFDEVATYLRTGNVFFRSEESDSASLATRLREIVESNFGTTTPVVMRTLPEIERTLDANPFLNDESDLKLLHVMFLDSAPDAAAIATLDPERSPGDRFHIDGPDIYLHYPNGSARSKLSIDYFERQLGVTATARNWNTVNRLATMLRDRADS